MAHTVYDGLGHCPTVLLPNKTDGSFFRILASILECLWGPLREVVKFKFHPLPLPAASHVPKQMPFLPVFVWVCCILDLLASASSWGVGSAWHCNARPPYLMHQGFSRELSSNYKPGICKHLSIAALTCAFLLGCVNWCQRAKTVEKGSSSVPNPKRNEEGFLTRIWNSFSWTKNVKVKPFLNSFLFSTLFLQMNSNSTVTEDCSCHYDPGYEPSSTRTYDDVRMSPLADAAGNRDTFSHRPSFLINVGRKEMPFWWMGKLNWDLRTYYVTANNSWRLSKSTWFHGNHSIFRALPMDIGYTQRQCRWAIGHLSSARSDSAMHLESLKWHGHSRQSGLLQLT